MYVESAMTTIRTRTVPSGEADVLDQIARGDVSPEMRDVLLSVSRCIREGVDVVPLKADTTLTPTQVADRLGMSRAHLYKLLDRGEIVSHRVGRDRRITLVDVLQFESKRQRDRRELAERFARQDETRAGAVDEIAS